MARWPAVVSATVGAQQEAAPAASATGPFSRMIMLSVRIPRGLLYFSALSPSSSGLGRRPFKAKIAGSNPAGGTTEAPARSSLGRPGFSHAVRRSSNREVARLSKRVQAFASERARARSARSCGCRRQARTPLGAPPKLQPGLPVGGRAFLMPCAGVRTERSRVPGALFAEARFFTESGPKIENNRATAKLFFVVARLFSKSLLRRPWRDVRWASHHGCSIQGEAPRA